MPDYASYDPKLYPYADILQRLTSELQAKDTSPLEAYVRFQTLRRAYDLRPSADYCSTAITSGGHARARTLEVREVITKNTIAAQQLLAELVQAGLLHPRSAIAPIDLGYIPSWSQSDYMYFWLAVIAGFDLGKRPSAAAVGRLHDAIMERLSHDRIDLELMNNPGATPADRAPEYFKFARALAHVTTQFRPEANSAHRVINLIDTRDSLGAQTERLFARLRGIPVYEVAVTGPKSLAPGVFTNRSLYEDLETIVNYGGTTVRLTGKESFVLRQSDALLASPYR